MEDSIMNKITFPLKEGSTGSSVHDLQEALQLSLKRKALLANNQASEKKFQLPVVKAIFSLN